MMENEAEVSLEGSVRVDLLGGTLDIDPLSLIIPGVVTINVATELKSQIRLQSIEAKHVLICSREYATEVAIPSEVFSLPLRTIHAQQPHFSLIIGIVQFFGITEGLKISLAAGIPPGSGLGGSSAMGITLFQALARWQGAFQNRSSQDRISQDQNSQYQNYTPKEIIAIVKNIEAIVLCSGPTGYQDYYPPLYGGILALLPHTSGVEVQQHYEEVWAKRLTQDLTLVHSGIYRHSGINNWEVFQAFFNQKDEVPAKLLKIAEASQRGLAALKKRDHEALCQAIIDEGEARKALSPQLVPDRVAVLEAHLRKFSKTLGIKMCGAGGGGTFLIVHPNLPTDKVHRELEAFAPEMKLLDFKIAPPLQL
jgi:D-glycero-alpha-D-manno-heptose-7-phosphate kinase